MGDASSRRRGSSPNSGSPDAARRDGGHASHRQRRRILGRSARCGRRAAGARRARRARARMPRRAHDRARAAATAQGSFARLRPAPCAAHRAAAALRCASAARALSATSARRTRSAPAMRSLSIARRLGVPVKVAVVTGDDVLDRIDPDERSLEGGLPLRSYGPLVSANAYLGADALMPALATGADVVVTGRVADPSLFVAPICTTSRHRARRLGPACARQPPSATCSNAPASCAAATSPIRDARTCPTWRTWGFRSPTSTRDGRAMLGKVDGTGGSITLATATEQLLYEVTDPHGYLTPDVIADFSTVTLDEHRPRPCRRRRRAWTRAPRPAQGERRLSRRLHRRRRDRLRRAQCAWAARASPPRSSVSACADVSRDAHRPDRQHVAAWTRVRRRRASVRDPTARRRPRRKRATTARIVGEEVEALYTNGPAGGGGVRKSVHEQIGIVSTLIDRARVVPRVTMREWAGYAEAV